MEDERVTPILIFRLYLLFVAIFLVLGAFVSHVFLAYSAFGP